MRRLLIITIFFMLVFVPVGGGTVAIAGEYEDAKVAFGAFADELYDFAGPELEQFLVSYPNSKLVPQARLMLVLCALENKACLQAAREFGKCKKPFKVSGLSVNPANLQLRIGECFLVAGERKKASDFFTGVVKEHGKSDAALKARFKLAYIFFEDEKFAAANQQVTPLLAIIDSDRVQLLKLDRETVYWISALSRHHLQKYKSSLPLLLKISAEFSLTNMERQDLYAIIVESAWHTGDSKVIVRSVKRWLQIPVTELEVAKLTSASLLAADLLRSRKRLAEIRGELIIVAGLTISPADKIALYELLAEIDRASGDRKSLKGWIEKLISLSPPETSARVAYLEALLALNYQLKDYQGVVLSGLKLLQEKPEFWQEEKLYYPYIMALGRLDRCLEIVKYVPAELPAYGDKKAISTNQLRLALDLLAGSCRMKLGRFSDAVTFYRVLYKQYDEPAVRVKLLATLYTLAGKIDERKGLDQWISQEVMAHFPLDQREDEKLLRAYPELVMLVAERQFRDQSYIKVLPSLLWLEKLSLKGRFGERVTFLLAESYYRCEDMAEAVIRFEALYASAGKEFRHLAALRLVTIYETQSRGSDKPQAYRNKLKKLYRNLLEWESDPVVRLELERKLAVLQNLQNNN